MEPPARQRNLALIGGAAIVALLCLVAVVGPPLARHDPLARTLVAEIGGRVRGVPFPPFQSWEFPLGSDRFGRDTLSRLLWAVRPTLVLVGLVAALRLALGVLVGAVAGWSQRLPGRALSGLTDAALTVPLLVVALAAIAAVGIETGLPAFIAGMALTGWAETAQSVRAATQRIAVQPYTAAARALGATGPQILVRHVGRHIAPMMAMLFVFEVSATLMLTAALGFLGYFIGGGVWIITDGDFLPVAERVAGLPELGQLVGTADLRISSRPPWEMLFPGLVIVLAILGFSLLGEGLRRRQSNAAPRPTRLSALFGGLEEAVVIGAGRWDGRVPAPAYGLLAAALLGGAGLLWWQGRADPATPAAAGVPALPRPAGWSAERGDPYGTLTAVAISAAPALAWEFADPEGLSGGPAIAPDGTLYVAGLGGTLHAVGPDGRPRWSAALEGEPIGAPAIGADGTVYVADRAAGLSAFSADGQRRWRFQSTYRAEATSGPIVGPDGTVYYAVLDAVQAVSPDGQARWLGRDPDLPYLEMLPRLSPDGQLVFLKSSAFSTADGSRQPLGIVPDEPVYADPVVLVGADGRTYYRSEHRLIPWRRVDQGFAVQPALSWSATNAFAMPNDAGVTAAGTAWLVYSNDFLDTRLVWISPEGVTLGEAFFPLRSGRALGTGEDGTMQFCGRARDRTLRCGAYSPAQGEEPLWELQVGTPGALASGGAVVDGRIYVVTTQGRLYALE